jgi:hypothetical protein
MDLQCIPYLLIIQTTVMKKRLLAFSIVIGLAACNNETNEGAANTSDSVRNEGNAGMPAGDTSMPINGRTGTYQADTSNQNGDDSVSGSNEASRSTTPGQNASDNSPQ